MRYLVVWKDSPGQQVNTVVDAHNEPVLRDPEYLAQNGIPTFGDSAVVLSTLELANGKKFAITPEVARATLGWDVYS